MSCATSYHTRISVLAAGEDAGLLACSAVAATNVTVSQAIQRVKAGSSKWTTSDLTCPCRD